jgi:peptide deformylase
MKIVQAPDPILSQTAQPVKNVDKTINKLLNAMEQTLLAQKDPEGVGLAAPQVGKSLRIFVVKQDHDAPFRTFINPVIEKTFEKLAVKEVTQNKNITDSKKKKEKGVQLEGCLSLKDVWGIVNRPFGVVVSYLDETGTAQKETFEGFLATIIQHEVDHLNGVLFPKRVLEQKNQLYHSIKNEQGEVEFEEIEI